MSSSADSNALQSLAGGVSVCLSFVFQPNLIEEHFAYFNGTYGQFFQFLFLKDEFLGGL